MDYGFLDDDYFNCELCRDDEDPDPKARRRDRTLCVRCDRIQQQTRKYGLTIPAYNGILRSQNDACALCKEGPDNEIDYVDASDRTFWHIDHDHSCCDREGSCGTCVRGILCHACNVIHLPAYERFPDLLRAEPSFNNYLNNPPAKRPEAQPTNRDFGPPRGTTSNLLDAVLDAM